MDDMPDNYREWIINSIMIDFMRKFDTFYSSILQL